MQTLISGPLESFGLVMFDFCFKQSTTSTMTHPNGKRAKQTKHQSGISRIGVCISFNVSTPVDVKYELTIFDQKGSCSEFGANIFGDKIGLIMRCKTNSFKRVICLKEVRHSRSLVIEAVVDKTWSNSGF